MTKEDIQRLFKKEKVDGWEIANACREYFHAQGYGKKKVYVLIKHEPDIISAAKQIFSVSSPSPIPQEHQVVEQEEMSSLLNSAH